MEHLTNEIERLENNMQSCIQREHAKDEKCVFKMAICLSVECMHGVPVLLRAVGVQMEQLGSSNFQALLRPVEPRVSTSRGNFSHDDGGGAIRTGASRRSSGIRN